MYRKILEERTSIRAMISKLIPSIVLFAIGGILRYAFPDTFWTIASLIIFASIATRLGLPVVQSTIVARYRAYQWKSLDSYAKDINRYKAVAEGDYPDFMVLYGGELMWQLIEKFNMLDKLDKDATITSVLKALEENRAKYFDKKTS